MQRRKTRSHKLLSILLWFLFALLLFAIAGGLILWRAGAPARALPGVWRAELDLTDHGCAEARVWLGKAELGEQVDPATSMPPLKLELVLTLNADGTWNRRVDAASYDRAEAAAREALAASLRELLRLRIEATGRGGGTEEYAEARIKDAVGMSGADWLRDFGPQLLPPLAELQAQYESGGSYRIEDGLLLFSDGRTADFLVNEGLLVLSAADGTEVYARA